MITFADTNVLLDIFLPDPIHGKRSSDALFKADRLLTRDRGFYKNYYKSLVILNPQNITLG